jgi:hypothetical protein
MSEHQPDVYGNMYQGEKTPLNDDVAYQVAQERFWRELDGFRWSIDELEEEEEDDELEEEEEDDEVEDVEDEMEEAGKEAEQQHVQDQWREQECSSGRGVGEA